ncbi:MAG: nucleotidyltransferase domain-containing protein [Gammaproteobacteria bacterium]|nr:MAG: nucleotidyltransferase domain-containing protein [Gammaproteobacteria bacterium]
MADLSSLTAASTHIAEQHPTLKLLILFGSRARGDCDRNSDWDVAFLSAPDSENLSAWFSGADLLKTLSKQGHISSDSRSERLRQRIDLIDLSTCSDILAHFVAQEGQLIYERDPGEFERFRQRSLKAPAELKQFRQTQREKVLQALERWGA